MKLLPIIAGLLSASMLHAEQTPPKTGGEEEGGIMETKSYGIDRYSRLMNKSPFDFDAPPPPPEVTIPAMQDWALAGMTKSTDYSVVILVNLKTQERLRLTRYVAPPSSKANQTKSGSDIYTLESIEFEEGKPTIVKNAKAIVTKNGEQGEVSFDPKVLQMKPAAGKAPMPAMPGMQPQNGQPQPNGQPGIPQPNNGQPGNNANGTTNQALLNMLQQRNAGAQPGVGVQQGQNQAQPNGQPQTQPAPALTNPPQPAQPAVFSNTGNPAPTNTNSGAQPRRRVVLPTNEPTPPPNP